VHDGWWIDSFSTGAFGMYTFQPRFPIDHVMALVKNLRSGEFERGDNLLLVGAISGEIGALLKSGFLISLSEDFEVPSTIHGCLNALDSLSVEDPQATFDPSMLIPIVLKLLELWLARRGS
jgi:hypothetical protein